MAVDLTTGSYDESGTFSKYSEIPKLSENTIITENSCSLKGFKVLKILKECSETKSVVVQGLLTGDDRPAIVVIEKMPFDTRDFSQLFSAESRLELKFRNSIYANYHVYLSSGLNGVKIQLIHPATEKDFQEFIEVPIQMVNETPEMYDAVIRPHFSNESLQMADPTLEVNGNQVLYNGLDEGGFLLFKEDVKGLSQPKHFRAKAVVSAKELLSLRDLTSSHVPLLTKLKEKCMEEICDKHHVSAPMVESYIRYPPSTFPFHVYFETVDKPAPLKAEQAHHLDTVIANLQLFPEYYQKVTLTYSLADEGGLLQKIKASGLSKSPA